MIRYSMSCLVNQLELMLKSCLQVAHNIKCDNIKLKMYYNYKTHSKRLKMSQQTTWCMETIITRVDY